MVKLRRGELIAVPPPDEALRNLEADPRAGPRTGHRRRSVLGTPAAVRDELERIAGDYGAQELIIVTITHDHAVRRRSYELLAEAFELEPREALVMVTGE
jgi:alkanesulfonate monooxygenase SsuD/methylene tetrahydromethanopterin reductase-like flavin-dependent oxidoreductase (luciferase family)